MCGPFHLEDELGKSTKAAAEEAAASLPEHALHDQYAGHGGSYIYDPASGMRMPAEQPIEQPAEAEVSNV
jgi:hypothetical protein